MNPNPLTDPWFYASILILAVIVGCLFGPLLHAGTRWVAEHHERGRDDVAELIERQRRTTR